MPSPASQNEAAIKNMLYGHLLGNLLPLLIRILFRWQAFQQSKKAIVLYCGSAALSQFLYQYLKRMGTPRRDSTGNLVSPGDDLNQPGMTEWTFDILYISCEAQTDNLHPHPYYCIRRDCPTGLRHPRRMVLVDIHRGKYRVYLLRRPP
jgi:hypothetical protein